MKEGFSSQYRDGLADSLKDLRKSGLEGPEKAQQFLALARETSLYQEAKVETRRIFAEKSKDTDVQDNSQSAEGRVIEEAFDVERAVNAFIQLAESDPHFMMSAAANGRLGGRDESRYADRGNFGYIFDQEKQQFVRRGFNDKTPDPIMYESSFIGSLSGDVRTLYEPFVDSRWWDQNKNVAAYQFWINFRKQENDPFSVETRGNLNFSAVLFFSLESNEYLDGLPDSVGKILRENDQEIWSKFLMGFLKKHLPERWAYLERVYNAHNPQAKEIPLWEYFSVQEKTEN